MRYLIAMIFAVIGALAATLFLSSAVASWVTNQFTFDNPDSVADMHALVFMGGNLLGLIIGWSLGWAIGGNFARKPEPH